MKGSATDPLIPRFTKNPMPVPDHECQAGNRKHHPYCAKTHCLPCYRFHQAWWAKTWAIRHPGESPSHRRYRKRRARAEQRCQVCGKPRKKRDWYCAACKAEMLRAYVIRKWRLQNAKRREANLKKGIARPHTWRVPRPQPSGFRRQRRVAA